MNIKKWALDRENRLFEQKSEVASMSNLKPQIGKNLLKLSCRMNRDRAKTKTFDTMDVI